MSTTMHRVRRALLGGALALVAVPIVSASPSSAADCVAGELCIQFDSTVGGQKTLTKFGVTRAEIQQWAEEDPHDPAYRTRRKAGEPAELGPSPARALTLRTLITKVNPELAEGGVTFSETPGRGGIPSVLSQADLGDPNGADYPFLDKLSPAIYLLSNGNIRYIRPLRGEDDVNVYDQFNLDTNLTLTFHTTGRLLEPVAKASSTSVNTKDKPTFSVTVKDPKTNLGYKWDFGDGTTSTKRSPTHRYATKGTYSATVTVRGDDGSYGRSSTITMKVAKPPKPPSTSGGGGGGGGTGGGGGGYIPPYIPNNPPVDLPPTVENPPTDNVPTTPVDDGLQAVEGFVLTGAGAGQGDSIPGTEATTQPTKPSELSTSRKIGGAVIGGLAVILLLGLGAEIETRWASTRLAHLRRRT